MLHSESRQGGTQGHRTLIIFACIFLALNISACKQSKEAEIDEAAQRLEQLYRNNSLDAQQHLDILIADSHDTLYADRMERRYYNEGGQWRWMGAPDQIALCDALDSVMHTQISAMGFREDIFNLADIDSALAVMHQPDSAQNVALTMAQLEHNLTQAYLRYTIGQRFGFTTPSKLFGTHNFDIEIEQADSAFVDYAMKQLTDRQTMLDFLASTEPTDSTYHMLKHQLTLDSTNEAHDRTVCNKIGRAHV